MNRSDAPRTIGGLQDEIGSALKVLGDMIRQGRLPTELAPVFEPLRELTPEPGFLAHVVFHDAKGSPPTRLGADIHDNAGVNRWQPRPGHAVRIWYGASDDGGKDAEKADSVRESSPPPPVVRMHRPLAPEVRDLVRELDRAERTGMPYVVLKWFRDTSLPGSRLPWASDAAVRQRVLSEAIEQGLVVTGKVSNPKNPAQPSTIVRLERSHPGVVDSLARPEELPRFRPVPVRGEPVSETIIRERR